MNIPCDIHVHIWAASEHLSDSFRNELVQVSGRPDSLNVPLDRFAETFACVRKVVIFGGRAKHVGIACPNEFIHRFAQQHPGKCVPFAAIDPADADFMRDFEQCVGDWNFRGVKLLPMYANFDPRDRRLDPLYAACEKRGLPILYHMGTTFCRWAPLRYTEPMLLEEVSERFPDLRMVIAHLGHPWEHQTAVLIRKNPNIFADISALFYRPWQLYNSLMLMQEYGVTRKLFFGTDYPITTPLESVEKLRRIMGFGEGSNFPRLDPSWMEAVFERDSLKMIGIGS
ncbi:MAG: amidohydrolase [Verrucomicrobia bacterium]|nr:amidohydrolase [Verrucomicrobiota bacterium]